MSASPDTPNSYAWPEDEYVTAHAIASQEHPARAARSIADDRIVKGMSDSNQSEWFAYSPSGNNSHLTVDQLNLAEKGHEEYLDQSPEGTVQVLFASLQPGQAEVRIQNSPGHGSAETIDAAIRELESARETFQETD